MSMLLELFGDEIQYLSLKQVKEKIRTVPADRRERRGYLLKEFAVITGTVLKEQDYRDINA